MSKTKTFRTKLWIYFIIFAAVIFALLWLFQTVFLQNFYNGIARFVQALSDAAQEYAKAEQTASSIGTKRG